MSDETPTKAEFEILKILWDSGAPMRVREVLELLNRDAESPRAYTTVMTLMNIMADKGLLEREPDGKAFRYRPVRPRERTLKSMLAETLSRVFDGSTTALVAHLLDDAKPSADELKAIRKLIEDYSKSEKKR
jgi:predicted transcriptional regulator